MKKYLLSVSLFWLLLTCPCFAGTTEPDYDVYTRQLADSMGDEDKLKSFRDTITLLIAEHPNDAKLISYRLTANHFLGNRTALEADIIKLAELAPESIPAQTQKCLFNEQAYGLSDEVLACYRNVSRLYEADAGRNLKTDADYILIASLAENPEAEAMRRYYISHAEGDDPIIAMLKDMFTNFKRSDALSKFSMVPAP